MTKIALSATLLLLAAVSSPTCNAEDRQPGIVFFTEWSALLDDTAKSVIKQDADLIGASKVRKIIVTGYADTTGSKQANTLLSMTRAQVVIDQLVADGVTAGRLKHAAQGATPDIGGKNESRRVVIAFGTH